MPSMVSALLTSHPEKVEFFMEEQVPCLRSHWKLVVNQTPAESSQDWIS